MNIQTATQYALSGYSIYRESWCDNSKNIKQIIYIDNSELDKDYSFMLNQIDTDDISYFILGPDDCVACDWQVLI